MAEAVQASGSQPQNYVSSSHLDSRSTPQDFVPDGDLDKAAWQGVHWVKVDRDAFKPATYPQSAFEIASLWTPAYVYFAYRCKFDTLNVYQGGDLHTDFWKLWERDVVEVFLNPQPEHMKHYYEFEVAPNNLWIDLEIDLDKNPFNEAKWDSGFEHGARIDARDHEWTCEMRIPVAGMKGPQPILEGAEWRVNFFRADGQGGDAQRRFLSWSPVQSDAHSFHSPWSFGVVRFVK
ncbi:MAG: carbohydrate-binding family 9-like protein [Terriglobia bacterium]